MTGAGITTTVDTSQVDAMLRRLAARAPDVGRDAARDTATAVAARARAAVPHRSGRLAGSVGVDTDGDGAAVVATAPYAGWIEYGGSRGRPYVSGGRYFGPAADGAERDMADRAAHDLEKAL